MYRKEESLQYFLQTHFSKVLRPSLQHRTERYFAEKLITRTTNDYVDIFMHFALHTNKWTLHANLVESNRGQSVLLHSAGGPRGWLAVFL